MDNKEEYIIISKTAIQKRIEKLRKYVGGRKPTADEYTKMQVYRDILSQSTPLIPEIEKAWEHGYTRGYNLACCESVNSDCLTPDKKDYIANLKLDI